MKFIIDDADIEKVREIWDLYPCDGVTTNPSILAKSGRNPYEVLTELREIVGKDGELHVQVVSKDAEGMVKEAEGVHVDEAIMNYIVDIADKTRNNINIAIGVSTRPPARSHSPA